MKELCSSIWIMRNIVSMLFFVRTNKVRESGEVDLLSDQDLSLIVHCFQHPWFCCKCPPEQLDHANHMDRSSPIMMVVLHRWQSTKFGCTAKRDFGWIPEHMLWPLEHDSSVNILQVHHLVHEHLPISWLMSMKLLIEYGKDGHPFQKQMLMFECRQTSMLVYIEWFQRR